MCVDAAEDIKLNVKENTAFQMMLSESFNCTLCLIKNKLACQLDLFKFSRLAETAKFRNKGFKAKRIRNAMTLHKSEKGVVQSITRKIRSILETRETEWNKKQKEILSTQIKMKLELHEKKNDYTKKLLQT